MSKGMRLVGAPAILALALLGVAGTEAAYAETATGVSSCGGTKQIRLRIDSSASGTGSWQNRSGPGATVFSFPAASSYRFSPYQSANWSVDNGSGFFYYPPSTTCIA